MRNGSAGLGGTGYWRIAMATDAATYGDQCGAVRHASGHVQCVERGCTAVVSVVERHALPTPIRFVLWCSLRACDECSENCLRTARFDCPST
jgi:hypothetical protein